VSAATPDPIRAAIGGLLSGDEALRALATGGVHHGMAPQAADYPFVVFHRQSGVMVWSMRDFWRNQVWTVKGVCRDGDAAAAEAIDARCEELLNDATMDIEGARLMYLRRESDIPPLQATADNGGIIFQVGGMYRVQAEPA
jgi:hypothetical protein